MKKSFLRAAAFAAVLAATAVIVWLATRGDAVAGTETSAHNHGAAGQPPAGATAIALTAADARRIGVTYAVATRETLVSEVRSVGQITFDETKLRTITAKVDGWVERLDVNATGQPIGVGQPLMSIYSPMLVAAQEELLIAHWLAGDVATGSPDAIRRANELLASARKRLEYWEIPASDIAAIESSGTVRRTMTLRASASGFVTEKNVVAGQRIMAGDPLYRVADLRTVWAEGEVFEQDLASIRLGQRVSAELDALPGKTRSGLISYVYPTVNAETRTARVRVVLGNGDLALKPGMYATLRISGAVGHAAVTVPRAAVLSTGERSIVFVREAGNHLAPREVSLGRTSGDRIEILTGLSAGETVVASATFLVDAESNLGTALGGMGNMPGMEVTTPPKPLIKKE